MGPQERGSLPNVRGQGLVLAVLFRARRRRNLHAKGFSRGRSMSRSVRIALAVAVCLAAGLVAASAQAVAHDTASLEFRGFHAGDRLADIASRVEQVDGAKLRCERAKVDRRINECRATLTDPDFGGP